MEFFKRFLKEKQFIGDYSNWAEAMKDCTGYGDDKILRRAIHCRNFVLQGGGAIYEQDLRLFHEKPYRPQSLAPLLYIATVKKQLQVLDFGGSFGTSYYIHQDFLNSFPTAWFVVEQENYYKYAVAHYETEQLKFFKTPQDCPPANVLYLSGVLACLENPYKTLRELLALKIPYIILDRNHTLEDSTKPTKLVVQKTNKMAVSTTFPVWLFNKKELMEAFGDYEVIREWREGGGNEGMYYAGAFMKMK